MDKYGCGVWSERRAETRDVAKVEVGRTGDVVDVGVERKGAVEDDTQTLDLRGGEDGGVIDRNCETV